MKARIKSYNLWVLIQPSPEFEGVWRADIPVLDYFAQGRTPTAAIDAAREVATNLILHELNAGREPTLSMDGNEEIARVVLGGTPVRPDEIDEHATEIVALAVSFRVDCVGHTVSLPVTMFEQSRDVAAA